MKKIYNPLYINDDLLNLHTCDTKIPLHEYLKKLDSNIKGVNGILTDMPTVHISRY